MIAGPADVTAETLIVATVTRVRQAEEPDPHGVRHVAVELDIARWDFPDTTPATQRSMTMVDQPCTRADAARLTELLRAAVEPDQGWLGAANEALRAQSGSVPMRGVRPFPYEPQGSSHQHSLPCFWPMHCHK
jgi:hypothetical protein